MAINATELTSLADELVNLIESTPDVEKKKELRDQLTRARKLIDKLVEENLKQASAEYQVATEALNDANQAIRNAKEDIAKVAETITLVAKAIDLVAEVAGTVV